MPNRPTHDVLDKLNKITDNDTNVSFIVTAIILVTFIIFILIVYNFLSKSSTNCKNIDKAYNDIYNIDDNGDINEKTLYKSQGNRNIDISFSFYLNIINNIKLIDPIYYTGAVVQDDGYTLKLQEDIVTDTPITSLIIPKSLDDLDTIKFTDKDHNLISKSFDEFVDKGSSKYQLHYTIKDKKYYRLTRNQNIPQIDNEYKIKEEHIPTLLPDVKGIMDVFETTTSTSIADNDYYLLCTSNDLVEDQSYSTIASTLIVTTNYIYIASSFVKIKQSSLKYTYSTKPDNIDNVVLSRDIELLNNRINMEKVLNKIHNNFILTAFNCCNSGEYQNNYVDNCILKKCLHLGVRCLDFQIFNYNQKPIIASSTMDSLYIKETFNYLELEPVLDIITNHINGDESNTSPLFLHFRVMSLSEKIYKQLIRSILNKLGNYETSNNTFELVSGIDNLNNISLKDLNKKIVVFINPYYTANNYIINEIDNYITEEINNLTTVSQKKKNYNIYKSGNILIPKVDLILFKNDNYDIYKDSHNKSKPTLVLPSLNTINNDESFIKYMQHNITFISMKFQEVDNFLQVAIYIFCKYENNSGFLLKNAIDSSILEINIQPDSVNMFNNDIVASNI